MPLKAGDNDVEIALESNFYGWALILRFDDLEGVHSAGNN